MFVVFFYISWTTEGFWTQGYDSVQNLLFSGCQIENAAWLICGFFLTETSNILMQDSNRARLESERDDLYLRRGLFETRHRKSLVLAREGYNLGTDIEKYLHPLYLGRVTWRRIRGVEINIRLFLPAVLSRILWSFWGLRRLYQRGND